MSDTDSFIDEVSEEVRRDKLFAQFKRYGWIAVAAIIAIVGGAAYNEYAKAQEAAAQAELGDAIAAALSAEQPEASISALGEITAEGSAAAVVALSRAGVQQTSGDEEGAYATLMNVVNIEGVDPLYRDLAMMKALMLPESGVPVSERREGFESLAVPGRPFRMLALEQILLLELDRGDTEAALALIEAIAEDAQTSEGLRTRVLGIQTALVGDTQAAADDDDAASDDLEATDQ